MVISGKGVISLDIFSAKPAPMQNMVAIVLIYLNLYYKNIKCIAALLICISACLKYIFGITNSF